MKRWLKIWAALAAANLWCLWNFGCQIRKDYSRVAVTDQWHLTGIEVGVGSILCRDGRGPTWVTKKVFYREESTNQ